MSNKGQLYMGAVLVLIGVIFALGEFFDISIGRFIWPLALILLGLWLVIRPQMVGSDTTVRQKILGDIRRKGAWPVTNEEIWLGVGDVRLDMTEADIPLGETKLQIYGFVGDVALRVPEGVGVAVSSRAFITDAKVLGQKQDHFLSPVHLTSDDYETAERKIRLETGFFIVDLKVQQV